MRHLVWLAGVILWSQITGCASLPPSHGHANDQVDAWLQQREYGKALAFVAELQASPPPTIGNVHPVHETIHSHIANYERQVAAEAEKAVAAQEWATAFDLYRDALDRLPDSRTLQAGREYLRQRHAAHLETLEMERLIAKGQWTLRDLEASQVAEAGHSGSWLARFWLNRRKADAHELALELATRGKGALDRNDLASAKRVLPLALNLSNTAETRTLNTQLQEVLQEETLRIVDERLRNAELPPARQTTRTEPLPTSDQTPKDERVQRQEQKGAKRLMDEFRKACQEKNLAEAQELMSQLDKQGFNTPEFEKLNKQLATEVARQVKHLFERGATHYSQQQYEEALSVWKQAQVLDPKNERLTARIKRATRVLEKLHNLRNKTSATPYHKEILDRHNGKTLLSERSPTTLLPEQDRQPTRDHARQGAGPQGNSYTAGHDLDLKRQAK